MTITAISSPSELREGKGLTKARWIEIMAAAGFDATSRVNWHKSFEKMEPEEHRLFLESLGLSQSEIATIRAL